MSDEHDTTAPRRRTLGGLVRWLIADERVRFLIVGAFNTFFGYGLFVAFELLVGKHTSYFVSLYGSFVIAASVAFLLHRHFTYRVTGTGNIFIDFLRFQGVNFVALGVNTLVLPLFVEVFGINVLIAQALIVIITTLVSYFGHKFFSFRRRAEPADGVVPETAEEPRA
ncbi:MAG: GtrA family protein [Rhodoglobus sp.]